MKRPVLLLLLGAFCFGGCVSARVSHEKNNIVTVENEGLFLFYLIPICTGDPEYVNEDVASWWENTVKLETNVRILNETAAKEGAHGVKNIVSHRSDEPIIYLLLKRKLFRTSAELIKD